jgi:CheY-like chemotaxis protein
MLVRFWGTRGSIATPGRDTVRYGGNTPCVEIVTDAGQRFICDCGTGVRALGGWLLDNAPKPIEAAILLSHTHWDHIQGFPFFAPLFIPGNRITVCGPAGGHASLVEILAGQMEFTYFPVELGQLGAKIDYREIFEGVHEIEGVKVTAQFLNHPAVTIGYRIEADGVSVLYLSDHEPYWEPLWHTRGEPGKIDAILHDGDRRHAAFMQNADVVIHDSQYTPEEYPSKKNWGHSPYTYVTRMAAAANVKRLFLTHHDPSHHDDFLDNVETRARELANSLHCSLDVRCACEGLEAAFEGALGNTDLVYATQARAVPLSVRILVIDDDDDVCLLASKALTREGHAVLTTTDGNEAMRLIEGENPDLVVLDLVMPHPDGFEVLRWLREREQSSDVPVLVLTSHGDERQVRAAFELGATDFLTKPFTQPQLAVRVRACTARAQPQ